MSFKTASIVAACVLMTMMGAPALTGDGVPIDPNGRSVDTRVPIDPNGAAHDPGAPIDPNGST